MRDFAKLTAMLFRAQLFGGQARLAPALADGKPLMDGTKKDGPAAVRVFDSKQAWLESHEEGYKKTLKPRQIQMIAVGGAIGTGLFLGAGARLQLAGPALALVYLVCGGFSFFILRAHW